MSQRFCDCRMFGGESQASRKHLLDTIKMIAYRAETAMAVLVREHMARTDDARALLRELYRSEADLLPDEKKKIA